MAEIILYVDSQFSGQHTHLFRTTWDFTTLSITAGINNDGTTWNDQTSSFVIVSGVWQFFRDVGAPGHGAMGNPAGLGPGLYSWVEDVGIDNDALSAVSLVRDTGPLGLSASWTHGNATELEIQGNPNVMKTPRGWGAEFSFPQTDGNTTAWLHVPIPTPVLDSDARASVFRFFLLFSCDPNLGAIDTVQLYDGPNLIQSFDDLNLGGSAFFNQIVLPSTDQGNTNQFVLDVPHVVLWGLSISFHFSTRPGEGSALLTVSTAGCDLLYP